MAGRQNRRSARTSAALVEAHNRLVLDPGNRTIGVADIVAEAGVGRSTFYDHYSSAEDIHLQALARPLAALADAAAGRGDTERLTELLQHFWANRARARRTVAGRTGARVDRLLADLVAARLAAPEQLGIPPRLAAVQLAAAAFAPVRAWLSGEAPCDAASLARAICAAGAANAAALTGLRPDEGSRD